MSFIVEVIYKKEGEKKIDRLHRAILKSFLTFFLERIFDFSAKQVFMNII